MFANCLQSQAWQRFATPIAIVALPLLGFYADRAFDEPITGLMGPALYTLYVLGLIAYATATLGRLPAFATSVAAGALGTGALISAFMQFLGIFAALFLLYLLLLSFGLRIPTHERVSALAGWSALWAIVLSPWLTAFALGTVLARALQSAAARTGTRRTIVWTTVGACVTIFAMILAQRADANWLSPRVQVFDTDDVAHWERSLREIKGNWLCGHRRCLMPVCGKLMGRFGRTIGESGFAPIIGFAIEAPKVPPELDGPFAKIYGQPVRKVCALPD